MIRRLLDRCQNIVTDDKDKEIEEIRIIEILQRCGSGELQQSEETNGQK